MIEWTLLLFTMLFITSKIIKGIPPSDQIRGVKTSKPKAIWVFAILSYITIIIVKVIANRNIKLNTEGEKKKVQGWWQVMNITVYFAIVILAYTFCLSYMCMKVRRKPIQLGGAFDWMDKGTGDTDIDPSIQLIILVGIILVILNSFTNLFLYLKNKEESEKDEQPIAVATSNPEPENTSSKPKFGGGAGTKMDPFVITPAKGLEPGEEISSKQVITISGLKSGGIVNMQDLDIKENGKRFAIVSDPNEVGRQSALVSDDDDKIMLIGKELLGFDVVTDMGISVGILSDVVWLPTNDAYLINDPLVFTFFNISALLFI